MIKVVFSFLLPLMLSFSIHPIHVSVTEIEYDEKDKALEMMSRYFIDDLETTLRERYKNNELDILNPAGKSLDEMMREYFSEKFTVTLDGKIQKLNYLGHERESEAFIFYIEVPKIKKWKTITVSNSALTETFEDQSNLVHVTVTGKVRSLRLTQSNPSGSLSF